MDLNDFYSLVSIPQFTSPAFEIYALDNGQTVDISASVSTVDTTVTCKVVDGGSIAMTQGGGNVWSGSVEYADFVNKPGKNEISCSARYEELNTTVKSVTQIVGVIELVPDVAPDLQITQPLSVCGNDGSLQFDMGLVDPASSYLTGAEYVLTSGSLPDGLAIDTKSGKLKGNVAVGDYFIGPLVLTATTVAGSDESDPFYISIEKSPCSP